MRVIILDNDDAQLINLKTKEGRKKLFGNMAPTLLEAILTELIEYIKTSPISEALTLDMVKPYLVKTYYTNEYGTLRHVDFNKMCNVEVDALTHSKGLFAGINMSILREIDYNTFDRIVKAREEVERKVAEEQRKQREKERLKQERLKQQRIARAKKLLEAEGEQISHEPDAKRRI